MSVMIAGERSGVGKTTVTLALLAALKLRGQSVQSFKVGPDYIDPMFHTYITGRDCRNLDPLLTSESYVQQCFAQHTQTVSVSLIEGVMGLFDGASGQDDTASTAHVARLLNLPVVLILNCSSASRSIAAIAHGYRTFDPRVQVAGLILNRVGSDRHLELLTEALAPLGLPILGVLRREADIALPDRHLGLIPAAELGNLDAIVQRLAHIGATCFDWSALMPLLQTRPQGVGSQPVLPIKSDQKVEPVRLAIAQDRAFSFYYADNLDILRTLGAQLVPWSPLADATLPEGVQGLYFGGGFPEVFAAELAANSTAKAAVKTAIAAGMPTYAECGGLMYLCDRITDFASTAHDMVGILPTTAAMGQRLTLGYRQAVMLQDSCIARQGERLWGHEFHRSDLSPAPAPPLFSLHRYNASQRLSYEGWRCHQVHASYVHLHFGAQTHVSRRFLQQCRAGQPSRLLRSSSL